MNRMENCKVNDEVDKTTVKDKILGGRARFNGIYFFASDCIVVCREFEQGFKLTRRRSKVNENQGILSKIPFVRSLLKLRMLVRLLMMTMGKLPKALILSVLFVSLFSDLFFLIHPYYYQATSSAPALDTFRYLFYAALLFSVLLLVTGNFKSFFRGLLNLFRFHGAEHKAINAAMQDEPLTVARVKSQSRISYRCGTTLVVIYLPLVILMNTLFGTVMFLNVVFSLVVAMEVFTLMKNRYFFYAFKPILWVSAIIQYLIMTKEPTNRQVEAATYAIRMIGEDSSIPWEQRIFYRGGE